MNISGRIEKQLSFRCTPEMLFSLLKRNQYLEHVVVYDYDVNEDGYVTDLFDALGSCSSLRLLYSETSICCMTKIHELINKHKFLNELAFPNVRALRATLEEKGWSGFHPSSCGFFHFHNGVQSSIVVLKKSADKSTIVNLYDSPAIISRRLCNMTIAHPLVKQHRATGTSLRQSMGPARGFNDKSEFVGKSEYNSN